jgi:hypothetical protein
LHAGAPEHDGCRQSRFSHHYMIWLNIRDCLSGTNINFQIRELFSSALLQVFGIGFQNFR